MDVPKKSKNELPYDPTIPLFGNDPMAQTKWRKDIVIFLFLQHFPTLPKSGNNPIIQK